MIDLGGGLVGVSNGIDGCVSNRIGYIVEGQAVTDWIPLCPDGDPGSGSSGGAGAPPPPPTHGEIVAAVCPAPVAYTLGRDPAGEGVTGLDTYLWALGPGALSASGAIRGYPVTCTLTPVSWDYTTGDGGAYSATDPGGPYPDQAATHMYEVLGDYTLELVTHWLRTTSAGQDTVTATHTEGYHVFGVRSALVDPASAGQRP